VLLHYSHMAKGPKIRWFAREWRKKKKMKLKEAAEKAGISVSYLHDLETGHEDKRWNEDTLNALAKAYSIDPQDLFWNPNESAPIWVLVSKIAPDDQESAAKALEGFVKKTGTSN
jgi:transcriptional regulator with XRE-family HTH domain